MQKNRSRNIKVDMKVTEDKKRVKKSAALSAKTDRKKKSAELKTSRKLFKKSSPPATGLMKTDKSRAKSKAAKAGTKPVLPQEYGENDLFLVAVDPHVVFASWEIKRDNMPRRGGVKIRFFDVTGREYSCEGGAEILDSALAERVGSGFFEIRMNGREVVAAIGSVRGGKFMPIIRSQRVFFPESFSSEETAPEGEQEGGTPIGY